MHSPTPRRNSFSSRMGRMLLAPWGFTNGRACAAAAGCTAAAATAAASLLPGPLLWLPPAAAAAAMGLRRGMGGGWGELRCIARKAAAGRRPARAAALQQALGDQGRLATAFDHWYHTHKARGAGCKRRASVDLPGLWGLSGPEPRSRPRSECRNRRAAACRHRAGLPLRHRAAHPCPLPSVLGGGRKPVQPIPDSVTDNSSAAGAAERLGVLII